jgi:hypothetical protein
MPALQASCRECTQGDRIGSWPRRVAFCRSALSRQSFDKSAIACRSQRPPKAPANELTPVTPWPRLRVHRCLVVLTFQCDVDVTQFAGLVSEPRGLPAQRCPCGIPDSRSKETDGCAQACQRNAHRVQGLGIAASGGAGVAFQVLETVARNRLQRHGARRPHVYDPPIRMPAARTRLPPRTICNVARRKGVSM